MKLPIVQAPNEVLAAKAKPIGKIDQGILLLIENMKETLLNTTDPEGVGLAAPQIGESLQLFIVKEGKASPFFVFINPTLELLGKTVVKDMPKKNSKLEGCLSLKDIWGTVKRAPKVNISYLDEHGQKHTNEEYKGFFATILQHEYDHLQGTLFPKRVLEQQGKLYKSHKDEKGEEVFDLLEI